MTAEAFALTDSQENYLETILILIREHAVARSRDIADRLKVTCASVTRALRSLSEQGLVNYEPYGYVTLTDTGQTAALRVLRRHEVLRDLFVEVLAVDTAEADEAACRMEHGISKHIVDRLIDFAGFMKSCPRAGSKWVRRFEHYCNTKPAQSAGKCKSCINESLNELR